MSKENDSLGTPVAADDRREGEFEPEGDFDPTTRSGRYEGVRGGRTSVAALLDMWATRDEFYAGLEQPLDGDSIQAVRAFRLLEVRDLTPKDQVSSGLATRALTWTPPR